jgi:hypothetical protein
MLENDQLKSRLRELESEKTIWTDRVLNSSSVRKGTALFTILLVVSINVGALRYTFFPSSNDKSLKIKY